MAGKSDVLRYVSSFGANINHVDNHGYSALYWASKQGNLAVVECLLQRKANVNLTDTDGWSPLRMAAKEGHVAIVKCLIQNGANVRLLCNLGFLLIGAKVIGGVLLLLQAGPWFLGPCPGFLNTSASVM